MPFVALNVTHFNQHFKQSGEIIFILIPGSDKKHFPLSGTHIVREINALSNASKEFSLVPYSLRLDFISQVLRSIIASGNLLKGKLYLYTNFINFFPNLTFQINCCLFFRVLLLLQSPISGTFLFYNKRHTS